MSKTIVYDKDARQKLLSGASAIAKAVRVTLGPSGKNVLIRRKGETKPIATKDGVTVAGEFYSDDVIEQQAIEAIQEVAANSDNSAGDGTSTATVLAEAILRYGTEMSSEETNLLDLKRGIDVATNDITNALEQIAIPCDTSEKLKQVALISSNNDKEISEVVVNAYEVAGNQGVVNIKRSQTNETYLTTIEGMNLPTGYLSHFFVTDAGNETVELDRPFVFITNKKIDTVTENLSRLLTFISQNQYSLLIICKDMDPSVLGTLVEGKMDGVLKVCVCKAPEFGSQQEELLKDLGVVLGRAPFLENGGNDFESIEINGEDKIIRDKKQFIVNEDDIKKYIPRSEAIIATKDRLSIKGVYDVSDEEYEDIQKEKNERADFLREKLKKESDMYSKSILQTRISRLNDGIAYINIGAISDIEFDEKQDRIKDALYAVKSAAEKGIIPGGGNALFYLSEKVITAKSSSVQKGIDIVLKAIQEPFLQIIDNVGLKFSEKELLDIKANLKSGIDARTGEKHNDLVKIGIIDPVKVTIVALKNAASIAGMLLTTDCVIIDNEAYQTQTLGTNGY